MTRSLLRARIAPGYFAQCGLGSGCFKGHDVPVGRRRAVCGSEGPNRLINFLDVKLLGCGMRAVK